MNQNEMLELSDLYREAKRNITGELIKFGGDLRSSPMGQALFVKELVKLCKEKK